jgi:hypothetical protein
MMTDESSRTLFNFCSLKEKIPIPYDELEDEATYFQQYAEQHVVNKCRKEGFVMSFPPVQVESVHMGVMKENLIVYDVVCRARVCLPMDGMVLRCKILSFTKAGIKTVFEDNGDIPLIVFLSREHNLMKSFEKHKVNDMVDVRVIGSLFELNDTNINVIGELVA